MKGKESTGNAAGPAGNLGLGLYIAERIVTAHGGRIEVQSTDVEGTTFTVHLPRAQ
jgi:Signal transduction histidine kinase